jgi:L-ascorbate metabolism protein UlaG (beta-lactamase superfamily)
MIITNHGYQCFKMQLGDTVLAFNPISKEAKRKEKPAKFGADAVLVTTQHPDFNGVDAVGYGDKKPFIIEGPGSYEILGNYIQGLLSKTKIGKNDYINTVYYLTFDDIKILFLGALSSKDLPTATLEVIEDVDIVFVPVGSDFLLPAEAHKLAVSFSPKLMIPMSDDDKALKQFLKEAGEDQVKPESKLTIKSKDLSENEADIFVFSS